MAQVSGAEVAERIGARTGTLNGIIRTTLRNELTPY